MGFAPVRKDGLVVAVFVAVMFLDHSTGGCKTTAVVEGLPACRSYCFVAAMAVVF
jgi:hypothetical protein